jgi:DNA-binding winged helix-turn-helix (wHTH) protein/tetratricopeptide (TPR) repeat protein
VAACPLISTLAHERPIEIGSLRLLPATREIIRDDGRRATVEPRVMQVLIALIRADGEIVTRDALIKSCWGGRIVGEDAINRVISRLRSTAAGIGEGVFRVETVTRIGYRLATEAPNGVAVSEVAPPARSPDARAAAMFQRGRRRYLPALILVLAVLVAGGGWRAMNPPVQVVHQVPQLRILSFVPLTPDLAPNVPVTAREEIVAAFGKLPAVGVAAESGQSASTALSWRLTGSVGRIGSNLRFIVHLTHESTGKIVWSAAIDRPAAVESTAFKSVAAAIASIVAPSLTAAASYRNGTLPDGTMALMLQFSEDTTLPVGPYNHAEEVLRRAVAQTPDFGAGWSALALALGYTATASDDPAAIAAARKDAPQVIARALSYNPDDAVALLAGAKMLPPFAFIERDRAYRRAIAAPQSEFGAEHSGYSDFLIGVGRIGDGVREAKTGYDLMPLDVVYMTRYARALSLSGQTTPAVKLLEQILLLWPGDRPALALRAQSALWTGDYDNGLAALAADANVPSAARRVMTDTLRTMRSSDGSARDDAARQLERLTFDPATNSAFMVSALGALGRNDQAIATAARLIASGKPFVVAVLFDPTMSDARRLPAFEALVGSIGLLGYWKTSGHKPDFCLVPDAPALCKKLKNRRGDPPRAFKAAQ